MTASTRYTGRHSGRQGKTARKWRVGRIVPVAAAAAAVAAGTTGYSLASGHPQAARLNAAMALPGETAAASAPGAGKANTAASSGVRVAEATASGATQAAAKDHAAKPTASRTLAAHRTPAATASPVEPSAAAPQAARPSAPVTTRAAAPAVTQAAAKPAAATTLSCNLNSGMLPQNVTAIVSFLVAHGYSDNAAAGIAGNIYQESKGNPESEGMGGGGLIGWTPLPSGFVTGNVPADLQTQLNALLTFNQGWSQYIPALNAAASPADAASIYVTDFERAGIPAAATREAAATDVAQACGI